jgi:hypothetical protein
MIPAATIQVILNHFALKLDPFSSVFAPRVYHKVISLPQLVISLMNVKEMISQTINPFSNLVSSPADTKCGTI